MLGWRRFRRWRGIGSASGAASSGYLATRGTQHRLCARSARALTGTARAGAGGGMPLPRARRSRLMVHVPPTRLELALPRCRRGVLPLNDDGMLGCVKRPSLGARASKHVAPRLGDLSRHLLGVVAVAMQRGQSRPRIEPGRDEGVQEPGSNPSAAQFIGVHLDGSGGVA